MTSFSFRYCLEEKLQTKLYLQPRVNGLVAVTVILPPILECEGMVVWCLFRCFQWMQASVIACNRHLRRL